MPRVVLVVVALALAAVVADRAAPHATSRLLLALERARAGLAVKRAGIAGVDTAYLEGGAGEPLVLVHGFGADKDNFTRVAGFLTGRFRVLVPDLPGFGDSARPADRTYTIAEQVTWLHEFVRAVGATAVHLGGNSMGGFIATQYALTYPDEVASLWLLAPGGTAVAFDSELTREIERRGRNLLLARTESEFASTMDFVMVRKPFMPSSIVRVLAERAVADYPLHARIFAVVGPGHVATLDGRLPELTVPTLVVWGTGDRALDPRAAEAYRAARGRVDVVLLDGVGHLPMLEAPDRVAADYLRFRDSLGGG